MSELLEQEPRLCIRCRISRKATDFKQAPEGSLWGGREVCNWCADECAGDCLDLSHCWEHTSPFGGTHFAGWQVSVFRARPAEFGGGRSIRTILTEPIADREEAKRELERFKQSYVVGTGETHG